MELAQEMVHNEYVDHKAQLHNEWVINADIVWRTQRTRIKYPSFPAYPSVAAVVARAEVMFAFLYGHITQDDQAVEAPPTAADPDPCGPENECVGDPSPEPMEADSPTDPVIHSTEDENTAQPEPTVEPVTELPVPATQVEPPAPVVTPHPLAVQPAPVVTLNNVVPAVESNTARSYGLFPSWLIKNNR